MEEKNQIRQYAKNLRKTLDIDYLSLLLTEKIRQNILYINSKNVMFFYPTKFEVNLLALLSDDKNFYLPRVEGSNLLVCEFDNSTILKKSEFNILEPCCEPVDKSILDLVIVPALVVDKLGYRLGYGSGYYDRFLQNFDVKTITAIPKELIVEKLPIEKFDKKIDEIISV